MMDEIRIQEDLVNQRMISMLGDKRVVWGFLSIDLVGIMGEQ